MDNFYLAHSLDTEVLDLFRFLFRSLLLFIFFNQ